MDHMTGTHEHLAELLAGPPDTQVLEAALLRSPRPGCDRRELAIALHWPLERLDAAARELEYELKTHALILVPLRGQLYLTPRTGVIALAAPAPIEERAAVRIPPTPGEAARLVSLIAERLTSPEPTAVSRPEPEGWDRDLIECGLLERITPRGPEQHVRVGGTRTCTTPSA